MTKPDFSARKMGKPTMPLMDRLYSHVCIDSVSGCWEWNGTRRNGYGRLIVGSRTDGTRKSESAHRLSYKINFGVIPDGMEVCHKCDNPACINPQHLFVGTRQDNVLDREQKGRNVVHTGEEKTNSKLTRKSVKDARWEYAHKRTSYQTLANRYGVSKRTIMNAIKGVTWKCVNYAPQPPEGK